MKLADLPKYYKSNYHTEVGIGYLKEFIKTIDEDTKCEFGEDFMLEMNPDFQRGHVWNQDQKVKYLEHLLMEGESGKEILFNATFYSKDNYVPMNSYCVDGLQRITAILEFFEDKFSIFHSVKKEGFKASEIKDVKRMKNIRLKVRVGSFQSKKDIMKWYLQINKGGTPHSEEELRRVQELVDKDHYE